MDLGNHKKRKRYSRQAHSKKGDWPFPEMNLKQINPQDAPYQEYCQYFFVYFFVNFLKIIYHIRSFTFLQNVSQNSTLNFSKKNKHTKITLSSLRKRNKWYY